MNRIFVITFLFYLASNCFSQYHVVDHRNISGEEVAVREAGSYDEAGVSYVLENDISSEKSAIFLGKDITLDLNGYTIRYADAKYESIPNSGFEKGLIAWDISKAPGAEIVNTADVHVFLGDKLLRLKKGDEIRSSYINLPVENRSYFAICGITGRYYHDMKKYPDDEMKISVYVEDERGNDVICMTDYGDTIMISCPVENKSPRLGGGFITAHLRDIPAGKYRVRIKAETDCLIDEIDIRPAMDVGISIIEKTTPFAHYDHLILDSYPPIIPAFYDYTGDMADANPMSSLPQVEGAGTIIIKNGSIESGAKGVQSWGIQSSSNNVKIILENVNIKTSGISSGAADIKWAAINNCRFNVDMPFLIQRHVGLCAVILRGKEKPSEVSNSEFYGGQGCLSIKGKNSLIHDNLFVNHQVVTNHYSIMGTGEGSKIYNNRFEPKQGSGIYVSRYTEVFNNVFKIETSAPTCEYGREEYSTAAIRLGDYGAIPGSPKASIGNRIHGNKIFITGKNYPLPIEYTPMSWGIFYSARGGENYVYDNEFTVNKLEPSSKVKIAALYICGGHKYFGGQFYNNKITTNVPAAWIATMYGGASNTKLYNNKIKPLNGADFKTFEIGSQLSENYTAENVEFRSNEVESGKFEIASTDQDHSFSVYWTLNLKVVDNEGVPIKKAKVLISDKNKTTISQLYTNENGILKIELKEYEVNGSNKIIFSPYSITINNVTKKVKLNCNKEITISVKSEN